MSTILDALRRADAERHRGADTSAALDRPGTETSTAWLAASAEREVRGCGAPGAAPRAAVRLGWREGLLFAGVAAVVLAAVGGYLALRTGGSAPPRAGPVAAPLPEVAPGPAPAPTAVLAVPPPTVVVVPMPVLPPSTPVAPPVSPPPALPAVPAAPVALGSLTPAQRQALPALSIGGAVWSEQASARFIIANGQLVREGEAAAPGVVVERIAQRSVVLRWQGLRIEWPL